MFESVGVLLLIPPAWQQGYYWYPGLPAPAFCDNPKILPNDVLWLSNAPYAACRGLGSHIKPDRFIRVEMSRLLQEACPPQADPAFQAEALGRLVQRLVSSVSAAHLRPSHALAGAYAQLLPLPAEHADWDALGREALTRYWFGSARNKLLLPGAALLPRFVSARSLLQLPLPDLQKAPRVYHGQPEPLTLRDLLANEAGFARVRIEDVAREVREFINLDRTLIPYPELRWWLDHAKVTVKSLYQASHTQPHPQSGSAAHAELQFFSWLDGLRMEALYLSAGAGSATREAYLRGYAHTLAAWHAAALSRSGVPCIGISMGKIDVALSRSEMPRAQRAAAEAGLCLQMSPEGR